MPETHTPQPVLEHADAFRQDYAAVREQIARAIVGHDAIVDGILTCLFIGGNALLEGVPGLGKTLLIRSLAQALSLDFSRIQFTPDLMPADITGTTIVIETKRDDGSTAREFQFQKGPLFAQIILADEINRATPKTQSAMLEAMQEKSVTVGGTTYPMAKPFFVMATQNPIEQEGTYPLPEAQLDRFLFKLDVGYSGRKELHEIINRTTKAESPSHRARARRRQRSSATRSWCARCSLPRTCRITPSAPSSPRTPMANTPAALTKQYLRFGASPRAAQALVLGAKVKALLDGRAHASVDDITQVLPPVLRHRVLLNFEGQAEGITPDMIINDIVDNLPVEPPTG